MSRDNGLSMLDANQVIQDVHNETNHALDVITVNNLVPTRYGKVEIDYINSGYGAGEVGAARYYSDGAYQSQTMVLHGDVLGSAHKTTLNFYNRTPGNIANKYFTVYDLNGPVTVWFDLDNTGTQPTTDSYRFIKVDIATGDTEEQLAQKLNSTINLDTYLASVISGVMTMILNKSVGLRQNTIDVNSGLVVRNTAGVDKTRLDGTYFLINSALDANLYYVWYNVDSLSTDPAVVGRTGIQVALTAGATANQVAIATANALLATGKFLTNISEDKLSITNKLIGVTTPILDVNCKFLAVVMDVLGANRALVAHLVMTYDVNCDLVSVERL